MWTEKYRPKAMEEVVGQEETIRELIEMVNEKRLSNLLFYGPAGTGKTSTVVALLHSLFGGTIDKWREQHMVLELNASDERGIDIVRDRIEPFATTTSASSCSYKVVVLDEADAVTPEAQAGLRGVAENINDTVMTSNVRFCLLVNDIDKIIPGLQSRCLAFRFFPVPTGCIGKTILRIAQEEKIKIAHDAVETLVSASRGDLRTAIHTLQACWMAREEEIITAVDVCKLLHLPTAQTKHELWHLLMVSALPLSVTITTVSKLLNDHDLTLLDVLPFLSDYLIASELIISETQLAFLLKQIANIELRLTAGTNEHLEIAALVGSFAFY